ncbi:unnamed protein product [Victoria cruziana]
MLLLPGCLSSTMLLEQTSYRFHQATKIDLYLLRTVH